MLAFILQLVARSTAPIRQACSRRGRLALYLAPLLVALVGCGGGQTPLAKLAGDQAAYVGKEVTTRGAVEEQKNPKGAPTTCSLTPARTLCCLCRLRGYVGTAAIA